MKQDEKVNIFEEIWLRNGEFRQWFTTLGKGEEGHTVENMGGLCKHGSMG